MQAAAVLQLLAQPSLQQGLAWEHPPSHFLSVLALQQLLMLEAQEQCQCQCQVSPAPHDLAWPRLTATMAVQQAPLSLAAGQQQVQQQQRQLECLAALPPPWQQLALYL